MSQTWEPDRSLAQWSALPLWRHLAALALISVVALLRWHHYLLASAPQLDEATYLEAFRAALARRSPYEAVGYHYTPFFAWLGARLLDWFGDSGILAVLRGTSVAGLSIAIWCSLAWSSGAWRARVAYALAYVTLAPTVGAGFSLGNVSFSVIGVILLALIVWSRRSLLAGAIPSGVALGATVAAKPLAPLALVALFCHRPAGREEDRSSSRNLVAGLVGGVTALVLVLPMIPRLQDMAGQPIHPLSYHRSFSLHRIFDLIGIDVGPTTLIVVGALLLAVLVRLRPLGRSQLVAVAVTASVMVTPIIWNHTLVLTLPLQVMVLSLALSRWRQRPAPPSRGRLYELIVVALGALALQFSAGLGAVDELRPAAQIAFLSVTYLTPAALLAYLLSLTSERQKA